MMDRRHFLKSAAALSASPLLLGAAAAQLSASAGEVFSDFENGTFDGWILTGNCWGREPHTADTVPGISGFQGRRFLCTLHPRFGTSATGKAVSREFAIEKPFISFLIGGGNYPGQACLNLVVDGKVVRTETGSDSAELHAAKWGVGELMGKRAHFEVIDTTMSGSRAYIMVDDVHFANTVPTAVSVLAPADQNWMKTALPAARERLHSPGAWIAVWRQGALTGVHANGLINVNRALEASTDDKVAYGSISKPLTGTLAAIMIRKGLLGWKTKASDVLTDLYRAGFPSSQCLKATVAQLLSHQAGLGNNPFPRVDGANPQEIRLNFVKAILGKQPVGAVREKVSYGPGADIVGLMLERLSQKALETLFKDELFLACGVAAQAQLTDPWYYGEALYTPAGYIDDPSGQGLKVLDGEGRSGWPSGMTCASGAVYGRIGALAQILGHCLSANKNPFGPGFCQVIIDRTAGSASHSKAGWSLTNNSTTIWSAGANGRGQCVVAADLNTRTVVACAMNQCDQKYYPELMNFTFAAVKELSTSK
jgi:CubicO group peptidase (beta-lactamase class C family)